MMNRVTHRENMCVYDTRARRKFPERETRLVFFQHPIDFFTLSALRDPCARRNNEIR